MLDYVQQDQVDLGQGNVDLGQDQQVVGVVVVRGAVGHELLLRHHFVLRKAILCQIRCFLHIV